MDTPTTHVLAHWTDQPSVEAANAWLDTAIGGKQREHVTMSAVADGPLLANLVERDDINVYADGIRRVADDEHASTLTGDEINDLGAAGVLLGSGHARRSGTADRDVAAMIMAALRARVRPIICCGETDEQHAARETDAVIARQLELLFDDLPMALDPSNLTICYQPPPRTWDDVTYTADHANSTCMYVRAMLMDRFEGDGAGIPILFGGAVTGADAAKHIVKRSIDGLLVDVTTDDPAAFTSILDACNRKVQMDTQMRVLNT